MVSPTPAAAYARVSTGMQVEAGSSLPSQLSEIRRFGEQNGYRIVEEYVDEGESARTADRPEFQRMIAAAKSRTAKWSAIITWKNSRFSRSREDAIVYKALLRRHGVSLLFAGEPNMDDSPTGRLMEAVIEAIDEFYSLNLGQEVLRGTRESTLQGFAPGGTAPFGLTKIPALNDRGRAKWRYAPGENAETVRELYRRYASGVGLEGLCEWLNGAGIRSARGSVWTPGQVWNVLFRYQPAYLGKIVYNKNSRESKNGPKRPKPVGEWTVCEDAHEGIVTQELADAVNLARSLKPLDLNLNHKARNAQRRLLSGLVVCGICGGVYSIGTSVKRGRKTLYYRCPRTGTCHNRWIQCEDLEAGVERAVLGRLTAKGFFRETAAAIERDRRSAERDANRQREAAEKRIAALRRKRGRLVDAIADGVLDQEDARERLEAIRREMDEIGQKVNQKTPEKPLENPQNILSAIRDLVTHDMGPEALRSLYSVVVGQVVVTRDSTVLSWRLPLENELI